MENQKYNFNSLFIYLAVIYILFSISICVKPEKDNLKDTQLNPKTIKNKSQYDKLCKITDKCRECTFEELKSIPECQATGNKQIEHCIYSNGKIDKDEEFITSSCNDNIRINLVFICLLIFIFIGSISFYVRKTHKNFMIKSMLERLSILKDK